MRHAPQHAAGPQGSLLDPKAGHNARTGCWVQLTGPLPVDTCIWASSRKLGAQSSRADGCHAGDKAFGENATGPGEYSNLYLVFQVEVVLSVLSGIGAIGDICRFAIFVPGPCNRSIPSTQTTVTVTG